MTTAVRALHWLVGVAQRVSLPGAAELGTPVATPLAVAWKEVARACALDSEAVAAKIASYFRLPLANVDTAQPSARRLLPEALARRHGIFPLRADDKHLVVATADPTNLSIEQDASFASGRNVTLELASPSTIAALIDAAYSPERSIQQMLKGVRPSNSLHVVDDRAIAGTVTPDEAAGPVVQLVNMILQRAVERNASDIHLQPAGTIGVVRYRVDGVLANSGQMPLAALNRVISRIKVMAKLDIADHLRPQDGSAKIAIADKPYELRISTVPARGAQKCVIRIISSERASLLHEVGLPEPELVRLKRLLSYRDGLIVVTGPTGSGKTTTLYAALQQIHREDVNIMTVEDPIERELPGVTQIQVETKQGVTFASALRAILRQDPDVIFVGEIRDAETAAVAAQAALTGHLVLATLHTNDAVGAIRRLADLGLDAATISSTFRGAVAQRLVRKLNPTTAVNVAADAPLVGDEERLAIAYGARPVRRAGSDDAAYRGWLPLVQVFEATADITRMIAEQKPAAMLEQAAEAGGMRTLRQVGVALVLSGETTLSELERVLGDVDEAKAEPDAPVPAPDAVPRGTIAVAAAAVEAVIASTGDASEPEASAAPHVLLADDDGANRIIARALLEAQQYRVTEACDGQAAVEQLASGEIFDLVVLDLDMPRKGGREVLHALRADVASAGIPVVILTGSSDAELETALLEEGADDYIRKPFDPRRFVSRVKATLRRSAA